MLAEPIVTMSEAQAYVRIETGEEEALLAGLIRTASGGAANARRPAVARPHRDALRGGAGMMGELLRRGEARVRDRQRQKVQAVAAQLRAMFGSAAVEVDEMRVLVRGRGMIKRWLIDPSLRFLSGGLS